MTVVKLHLQFRFCKHAPKKYLVKQGFSVQINAERFILCMNEAIKLSFYLQKVIHLTIETDASKSEVNRLLMLEYLSKGLIKASFKADSADVLAMQRAMASQSSKVDIGDAGTAMRFLTAAFAYNRNGTILTGSPRMQERPIGALVKALIDLGAKIEFLNKDGYPPLTISGTLIENARHLKHEITLPNVESSQFVTALMLLGPFLPKGLKITLPEWVPSASYIRHTEAVLRKAGVEVSLKNNTIRIEPISLKPLVLQAESDWSSAGYWFSFLAQLPLGSTIRLKNLFKDSAQADAALVVVFKAWGIKSEFYNSELKLTKEKPNQLSGIERLDFSLIPDQAQTLLPLWAVSGNKPLKITGLSTLFIKETDRIAALKAELQKLGAIFSYSRETDTGVLEPNLKMAHKNPVISTYGDHRMALGFAVLVPTLSLEISEPQVVKKSYPNFWKHLEEAGVSQSY